MVLKEYLLKIEKNHGPKPVACAKDGNIQQAFAVTT